MLSRWRLRRQLRNNEQELLTIQVVCAKSLLDGDNPALPGLVADTAARAARGATVDRMTKPPSDGLDTGPQ